MNAKQRSERAALAGAVVTPSKRKSSARNGKLGGRPRSPEKELSQEAKWKRTQRARIDAALKLNRRATRHILGWGVSMRSQKEITVETLTYYLAHAKNAVGVERVQWQNLGRGAGFLALRLSIVTIEESNQWVQAFNEVN